MESRFIHPILYQSSAHASLCRYMSPSAPRCQTTYLKWICDHSRISMNDSRSNGFVIPEADHRKSFLPPDPFLISARSALVSMCGQILATCGIVHLSTSCQAQVQLTQSRRMELSCGSKNLKVCIYIVGKTFLEYSKYFSYNEQFIRSPLSHIILLECARWGRHSAEKY